MLRTFVASVAALVICAGGLLAAEVKGKIKDVDAAKKTITVTVDGKDTTYTIGEKTQILNAKGKAVKDGINAKALKAGANVTITTEKKDGKDEVTEVKLGGGKKQDKDK